MANQTVKANLKLIEELQKENAEMRENLAEMGDRVLQIFTESQKTQKAQALIAETLATLLGYMIRSGTFQDLKTHKRKWKAILERLREVTNATNTEGKRDSED